jgi:hypothetical protein
MKLMRQPVPPDGDGFSFVYDHHHDVRKEWLKYLPNLQMGPN